MKLHTSILVIAVLINSNNCFSQNNSLTKNIGQNKTSTLEDTVYVIQNHVKPDKKQQFDDFLNNVFLEVIKKERVNSSGYTTVLRPISQEADSTYNYFFIVNFPKPSTNSDARDLDLEHLLQKYYGKEKAHQYIIMFSECIASQDLYKELQSKD